MHSADLRVACCGVGRTYSKRAGRQHFRNVCVGGTEAVGQPRFGEQLVRIRLTERDRPRIEQSLCH